MINFWRLIITALLILPGFFLAGCGGIPIAKQVSRSAAAGDYAVALAAMEKNKQQFTGANNLLYYFDHGSLLQRLGNFSASLADLEKADLLIDELYGTSVTQAAASFLINDMTMDYIGEDFEQVMVNVLKELNYLYSQDLAGAMVEARKVDTRLVKLAGKYGTEAVYKQDAFARYLAGYAHEADGALNDAYIDYKKAFQTYQQYEKQFGLPVPSLVKEDLLRLSRWLGFLEDYEEWRTQFAETIPVKAAGPRKRSEVLLVVYDGMVPEKYTKFIAVPILDPDQHPYTLKVAFPAYQPSFPVVQRVRIGLPDGTIAESQVMEPVDAIAYKSLEQRIGLISLKAIARATAKFIAAFHARRAMRTDDRGTNLLIDIATNVFTYATEQADTRSWQTLPNRFHVARMVLPPGKYSLEVRVEMVDGAVRSLAPIQVELKTNDKAVIPLYVPR